MIFAALVLITAAITSASLAPWVPARKKDLARICRLADMKPGEIFYDLGAGDGRVAFYVARYSAGTVIGIELSLLFYLTCLVKKLLSGAKNLNFKFKDVYNENLSDADAIFIFPASRRAFKEKLLEKLKRELKPGTRIITYVFPVEAWRAVKIDKPDKKDIAIYLYII